MKIRLHSGMRYKVGEFYEITRTGFSFYYVGEERQLDSKDERYRPTDLVEEIQTMSIGSQSGAQDSRSNAQESQASHSMDVREDGPTVTKEM